MLYFRTAEALLNQVSTNAANLGDLQNQLDRRVGKHVDIREQIIKKKDDELKGKSIKTINIMILRLIVICNTKYNLGKFCLSTYCRSASAFKETKGLRCWRTKCAKTWNWIPASAIEGYKFGYNWKGKWIDSTQRKAWGRKTKVYHWKRHPNFPARAWKTINWCKYPPSKKVDLSRDGHRHIYTYI